MRKKKFQNRERQAKKIVLLFIGALFLILIVAYVVMKVLWGEYAAAISINYYIALAGILPVLLVALFLTPSVTKSDKRVLKSIWYPLLSEGKTEGLVGFTLGEAACLAAIAMNQSKTFFLVASIFGIVVMLLMTFRRIVYGHAE